MYNLPPDQHGNTLVITYDQAALKAYFTKHPAEWSKLSSAEKIQCEFLGLREEDL